MGNKSSQPPSEDNLEEEMIQEQIAQSQANSSSGRSRANSGSNSTPQSPSYYTMIKNSYQALVNAIIRPPRSTYEIGQLGPHRFRFCGRTIKRTDFTLLNDRNLRFCCSMWEPVEEDRPSPILPCVIYMHGNSSSRLEALSSLSVVLTLGATLLAFDFCGSGLSEGEYVSLGAFEKDDLQRVIEHLRCSGTTSTIALWGRSMGAATALLHGERDPSIASMILDSSFADLVMLAEEMVEKGRQQGLFAPSLLVKIAIKFVRSSVQKAANFDIRALSPIEHADKCYIPALFVAAEGDNFVMPSHSQKIFDKYGGDKNIIIVEGDHNTPRPRYLYDAVSVFLQSTLQIPEDWVLREGHNYTRRLPWTAPQGFFRQTASGPNVDAKSENDMQRTVKDSVLNFFSGGTSSSSKKESKSSGDNKSTPDGQPTRRKSKSKDSSPPPGVNLLAVPEGNERSESSMTTVARKYSKTNVETANVPSTLSSAKESSSESSPVVRIHRASSAEADTWICATCTLINSLENDMCEACGVWKC